MNEIIRIATHKLTKVAKCTTACKTYKAPPVKVGYVPKTYIHM